MAFSANIKKFVAKYNGQLDVITRELNSAVFSSLVYKSPVKTGAFRGNWRVNIGDKGTAKFDEKKLDPAGAHTVEVANKVLAGVKAGDVVYHSNNAPYGPMLESGSSAQAPTGMVGLTILEFNRFVNDAVAFSRNKVR